MRTLPTVLFIAVLSLTGCYYDDPEPYVIFKDAYAETIVGDTVFVALNSSVELLVEAGSDANSIQYLTQKNDEEIKDISDSEAIRHSSNGWNGRYNYSNVIIKNTFSDTVYQAGDVLRVTVRFTSNGWYGRSLFYKVN